MTPLDWAIVVVLNGGVVLYSLFDWYLAGKSMPW